MNKLINSPKGAAGEYASYAMSFYEGCMEPEGQCKYCYMKAMSNRFGSYFGKARLKEWLKNEGYALDVFKSEVRKQLSKLQKYGLFFNFSSDPCLPESFDLNFSAWHFCAQNGIPITILTKQAWWVNSEYQVNWLKDYIKVGFTITGSDDQEPGAAKNIERIGAAKTLHKAGFKTFGSFEPAVDLDRTYEMILLTLRHNCIDLYKIGLQSGKRYDKDKLLKFLSNCLLMLGGKKVYFKDSLLIQAGVSRDSLLEFCVDRTFNL